MLIPHWRQSWKLASNVLAGVLTIVDTVYLNVEAIKAVVTPEQFLKFNAFMGVAIIVARVIRQSGLAITPTEKEKLLETVAAQPEKPTPQP